MWYFPFIIIFTWIPRLLLSNLLCLAKWTTIGGVPTPQNLEIQLNLTDCVANNLLLQLDCCKHNWNDFICITISLSHFASGPGNPVTVFTSIYLLVCLFR